VTAVKKARSKVKQNGALAGRAQSTYTCCKTMLETLREIAIAVLNLTVLVDNARLFAPRAHHGPLGRGSFLKPTGVRRSSEWKSLGDGWSWRVGEGSKPVRHARCMLNCMRCTMPSRRPMAPAAVILSFNAQFVFLPGPWGFPAQSNLHACAQPSISRPNPYRISHTPRQY
jgi:hypothetical protein